MPSSTNAKDGEVDMCEYVRYFCSTVAVNLLVLVAFIGTPRHSTLGGFLEPQ